MRFYKGDIVRMTPDGRLDWKVIGMYNDILWCVNDGGILANLRADRVRIVKEATIKESLRELSETQEYRLKDSVKEYLSSDEARGILAGIVKDELNRNTPSKTLYATYTTVGAMG